MTTFFPHVNLTALKKFAATTAEHEHPYGRGGRKSKKPVATVTSCEDIVWAGEKVGLSPQTHFSAAEGLNWITDDPHYLR